MDSETARAILSEVASGGWLKEDLPENEDELISRAEFWVEEAKLAVTEEGMGNNEHIIAIINLAKASPPVLSEVAVHNHDGTPPGEIEPVHEKMHRERKEKEELIRGTYPRRSSGGFSESDLREDFEGFPLPQSIPEDSLDMPTDLTEVGDKAVRRLYSAFTSYYNRARWKLALAQSSLTNATHLRDAEYRRAYKNYSQELIKSGERATKDLVDSFALGDADYKEWNDKAAKHEEEVIRWRALQEIYGKNVEVLSREWTMRTEQYERER